MKNILTAILQILGVIMIFVLFIVSPIWCFISCENQRREEHVQYIKEANKKPIYYEITYIDGYKDTIKVYDGTFHMYMSNNIIGDKEGVYVEYIPYRKYSQNDGIYKDYETIYNVLRAKQIH